MGQKGAEVNEKTKENTCDNSVINYFEWILYVSFSSYK